jgi:hypothetical protein
MATEYPVKMTVQLKPVGRPWIKIGLAQHQQIKQLETVTDFHYDFDATDQVCLRIEHFDKDDLDPSTAVEIVSIEFFGIKDPKFAWAGTYFPDYPSIWYNQQTIKPAASLPGQTYLGWNGVYKLEFTVPVFTWMHNVLDMGWIYT